MGGADLSRRRYVKRFQPARSRLNLSREAAGLQCRGKIYNVKCTLHSVAASAGLLGIVGSVVQGTRVFVLARPVKALKPLGSCFPPLFVVVVRTSDLAFSC